MFVTYRLAGTPGYWRKAYIGCEVCGRGEGTAGYLVNATIFDRLKIFM